jgi:hypothetical protein
MSEAIDLLWTGGWDSTYRLLHLLLVENRSVRPWYLIDPERASTREELRVQRRIKDRLKGSYGLGRSQRQDTEYVEIGDLPGIPWITDAFNKLRQAHYMGQQYEWIARFAEHHDLCALELSIHRDDRAARAVADKVWPDSQDTIGRYRLKDDCAHCEYSIFARMRFPLLDTTKVEMNQAARVAGFDNLLHMAWFCHNPTRNGSPCGVCFPCRCTIEEGLASRVPRWARWTAPVRRRLINGRRRIGAIKRRIGSDLRHIGARRA